MRTHDVAEAEAARLIGAEIRRLREARGLTLRQVADATDLDFGYIGKIERGENATVETYRKIAGELGATLSALFAIVDHPPKSCRPAPPRHAAHRIGG
jgi:transcriptional regulator with XRE-family HTH domain